VAVARAKVAECEELAEPVLRWVRRGEGLNTEFQLGAGPGWVEWLWLGEQEQEQGLERSEEWKRK